MNFSGQKGSYSNANYFTFFGIVIRIFHKGHNPPHFHATYAEHKIIVEIKNGKILNGKLPPRALKLIQEWRKMHLDEIERAWDQAQKHQEPKKISPLE